MTLMPSAFIHSMNGYSLGRTLAPFSGLWREAARQTGGVADDDHMRRDPGGDDRAGADHGRGADIGHHDRSFANPRVLADFDLDETAHVGGHPASLAVQRVHARAADDARAGADQAAAPQPRRSDDRVGADVGVLLDARVAVREERAEADEEAHRALIQGQLVERAAQRDAGQTRDEREALGPEREDGFAVLAAGRFEGAHRRRHCDHGDAAEVDGALDRLTHDVPYSAPAATAPPMRRTFLNRSEWSVSTNRTFAGIL